MSHLGILAKHRDAILLMAAGALLHNLGKISAQFIRGQVNSGSTTYLYQHVLQLIAPHCPSLPEDLWKRSRNLADSDILETGTKSALSKPVFTLCSPFDDRSYCPGDLIEYLGVGEPWYKKNSTDGQYGIEHIFSGGSRLTHLMNRAHRGASGGEKEGIAFEKQLDGHRLWLSTPFGWETPAASIQSTDTPRHVDIDALRQRIENQIQSFLSPPASAFSLAGFANAIRPLLSQAIADTRRPMNDVTIWDIGHTGMAFLVTQAIGLMLKGQPVTHDFLKGAESNNQLFWRILSVRTDGLRYIDEAASIADLRVRQRLIEETFDRVQEKMETFLAGVEIYRDENSGFYLCPDLDQKDSNYKAIERELEQVIEIDGVKLTTSLSPVPLANHPKDNGTYVGDYLNNEIRILPKQDYALQNVQKAWQEQIKFSRGDKEICIACNLRPQGYAAEQVDSYKHNPAYYNSKALSRNICCICMHHRSGVAGQWATEQLDKGTIWTDEVADTNGRLALITGCWQLDNFIRQIIYPGKNGNGVESQSFARIRRIWETTRRFWQHVLPSDKTYVLTESLAAQEIGSFGPRLEIKGKIKSREPGDNLGDYHVYDLVLSGGNRLNVVWDPGNQRFITADNLSYLAKSEKLGHPVKEWLAKNKQAQLVLEEPAIKGGRNKVWGNIRMESIHEIPGSFFAPVIPILAEPRTFMALVPADKALDVVDLIKAKYEREMGKVRNRLPLHLGVVYFHRRTPLRAALDAGRRMLQQDPLGWDDPWTVLENASKAALPGDKKHLGDGTKEFEQSITVQLARDEHCIRWCVPAVMGDGTTEDKWYPYIFIGTDGDDSRISGRSHVFKGQRPTANGMKACWLIHASQLRKGDKVYFTPATFDFEWLDTSARRFEIAYDGNGNRLGRLTRPYLLDELEEVRRAWKFVTDPGGLTASQIHALREAIETKREAWQAAPREETFKLMCRNAVLNAKWARKPDLARIDKLADWAASGLFADTIELHMGIMKQKPQRDEQGEVKA